MELSPATFGAHQALMAAAQARICRHAQLATVVDAMAGAGRRTLEPSRRRILVAGAIPCHRCVRRPKEPGMACFVPIAVMIERSMPDGSEGLLLASDLASALAAAVQAQAAGEWTVRRIVLGRESILEGEALTQALVAAAGRTV